MAEVQEQALVSPVFETSPSPQERVVNVVAASSNGASVVTSLYVGDLDLTVTEANLYDLFTPMGKVVSVRICQDTNTRCSLGYGYVNYSNALEAARALDELNFTPVMGKPIRIMYSNRDPTARKTGSGNIFIKNLDKTIDNKALHDTFSTFGKILSCKIATDNFGQSKGYGFVQFDNEESAKSAIDKVNGMLLNDKPVFVGPFLRKQERESSVGKEKFSNVYVKNLSESTTDEDLKNAFNAYGPITSAVVMRDADGKSKCFGFVNFENPDDAARSVDSLNGKKFGDKEWFVGKAMKKSEREMELKGQHEQNLALKDTADKIAELNLYVKNLDDSINDDKLRELFSEFGTVTSCRVMLDPNGISRGSGFVAFSTVKEASRALVEMNGKMVVSKPLYVAVAQRREDRRARLEEQFSHMRPGAMGPDVSPQRPMYPPGVPRFGQQLFYGQGLASIIPPQPGFGYQQQLVPGMMPNFFTPMHQPRQQNQHKGGRLSGAGPMQQGQQPLPFLQPQMHPNGRAYRHPSSGRNMPAVPGRMLPAPYDVGGLPFRYAASFSQHKAIGALACALANASPVQQRTWLGESLYPLVDQLEHENAAKVTGMLLEMDLAEVLSFLESPEALRAKVAEAMEVLKQANITTDRLASLSLNENLVS